MNAGVRLRWQPRLKTRSRNYRTSSKSLELTLLRRTLVLTTFKKGMMC